MTMTEGRQCGECKLCCKLLGIVELNKPPAKWCPHAAGRGCGVYSVRPESCRSFFCLWLQGVGPEDMKPSKSRVVFASITDHGDQKLFTVHVDAGYPNAWKKPLIKRYLDHLVTTGAAIAIVCGEDRWLVNAHGIPEGTVLIKDEGEFISRRRL